MSAPKAKLPKPSHPRHSWLREGYPARCSMGCGWSVDVETRPRDAGRISSRGFFGRSVDVAVYTHTDGRRVERPGLMWRDVPCIPRAK